MKKTTLVLLASLPLFAASSLHAVSVSTAPVGFINLTIKGGGFSAISVPMLPQTLYSGVIGATSSGTTLIDDAATWTDNQYAVADPNSNSVYYVEITANSNDDSSVGKILEIISCDDANNSMVVSDDVSNFTGASYMIRKFRTLGDVFGNDNSTGLLSGAALNESDVIFKIGSDAQGNPKWTRYYYQTDPTGVAALLGGTGWRRSDNTTTDFKDVVISPDEGLLVKRNGATDLTITLPGTIKTNKSKTPLLVGFNLIAYSFPVDATLDSLNLQDKLVSGASVNESDVIFVINASGGFTRYYYQTDPTGVLALLGGTGWRSTVDTTSDASSTEIGAGSAIIIQRRPSATALVEWDSNVPF